MSGGIHVWVSGNKVIGLSGKGLDYIVLEVELTAWGFRFKVLGFRV